jgi:AraC-like DNA-binding protein
MHDIKLRRLSELRAVLEGLAARHAATHSAEAAGSLKDLRAVLKRLTSATRRRDYAAFRASDHELHACIVGLAAVPQLLPAWQSVWDALKGFHRKAFDECFPDARFLSDEHEHLVETIALGDPTAAEDAARSHVEAVWFRIAEQHGDTTSAGAAALQRAAAHLAFRFGRPLRLGDVAAKVAFTSPGHLSRLFRQHYGLGFQAHLQELRLEKAAELLRTTKLPVARIAKRVGYRDVSRFGQHFKRRFVNSPTAWRYASHAGPQRRQ